MNRAMFAAASGMAAQARSSKIGEIADRFDALLKDARRRDPNIRLSASSIADQLGISDQIVGALLGRSVAHGKLRSLDVFRCTNTMCGQQPTPPFDPEDFECDNCGNGGLKRYRLYEFTPSAAEDDAPQKKTTWLSRLPLPWRPRDSMTVT
jgi:hypothetical protein